MKAQALFQTLADEKGHVAPTRWLEIIKSVPHSKQARLFYARSLIADGQFEDAHQQLTELPETIQQQLLLHQIDEEDKEIINAAIKSHTPSSKWSHRKKQPLASYYVHQPHLSPEAGILLAIQKQIVEEIVCIGWKNICDQIQTIYRRSVLLAICMMNPTRLRNQLN